MLDSCRHARRPRAHMSSDATSLPSFRQPPVTEVVLSVQFDALVGFELQHFGALWERFKDKFPKVETKPSLEPVWETFEPAAPPRLQIRLLQNSMPRMWLVSTAGTELIQVQNDRFIHNWRKVGSGDEYPRYERIRREFETELTTFIEWCSSVNLPVPQVRQCEITYLNQIAPSDVSKVHTDPSRVTTLLSAPASPAPGAMLESVNLAAHYVIAGAAGTANTPLGRLHVEMTPAFAQPSNAPIFMLNLTARGAPRSNDVAGALSFMDMGRRTIVTAFKSITTTEMHVHWGIER